jgi:alpha-L-rhamnosidase
MEIIVKINRYYLRMKKSLFPQTKILSLILFLVSVTLLYSCQKNSMDRLNPVNLKIEGLTDPGCVDAAKPRFSWQAVSEARGQEQTAYRIIVASSEDNIRKNIGDMFDSKKIRSSENLFLPYEGKTLESAGTYYWKVKIWDKNNKPGNWSQHNSWNTGLINMDDKKARWIANRDENIRAPLLRKEFVLEKPVKNAYAYVSGVGIYYFFVNGMKAGDAFIDPPLTDYRERILYRFYDVKSFLNEGKNAMGLFLGEGMGAFSIAREDRARNRNKDTGPYDKPMGWLQLEIEYEDGTKETLITDKSWKTNASHISYNNFYGGEDINANQEIENWSDVSLNDENWDHAEEIQMAARLQVSMLPPVRIKETFLPIFTTNPEPGIFCYDFGQNIGGIWRLKMKGDSGTRITIRGSERLEGSDYESDLNPDSRINLSFMHAGNAYFMNCFSDYILSGKPEEIYQPSFFFHGFRYLHIETNTPENIDLLEPEASFVYTDLQKAGEFECSDTLLNRIYRMAENTVKGVLKSNLLSNPHSEKYGWLGDDHLASEAANINFNMYPVIKNWLEDMDVSQKALGDWKVTDVNPSYRIERVTTPTGPAWGATLPVYVLSSYRYYGDLQIVEKYFENVKGWCDYLTSVSEDYIVRDKYGDWGAPGYTPEGNHTQRSPRNIIPLIGTAYYYRTVEIVAELAGILGRTSEKEQYKNLAENIKNSFNVHFLNKEKGIYEDSAPPEGFCTMQTANLLPLEFGMVPEDYIETVLKNLVKNITLQHTGNLSTGFVGTKSLMVVLPKYGLKQLLYDIIRQDDYPGYGYLVKNGATTLWEFWDGLGDHMHPNFLPVQEFHMKHVLGIHSPNTGKTTPGFKHIHIEPWVNGEISYAKGFLECPQGKIAVEWKKDEANLTCVLNIPFNSTASIVLPVEYNMIYESGKLLMDKGNPSKMSVPGITDILVNTENLEIQLGSGNYSFLLSK